ncbi:MAG: patatin-like phospholipase family protein [Alphaproteobacteria bacterium]
MHGLIKYLWDRKQRRKGGADAPRPRIGLALGSGAARGWAHLGVIEALSELKLRPDVVCGTSIGALVGGFYLSGQVDALKDWACRLTKLGMFRYLNLRPPGKGIIAGRRLFTEMERYLRDTAIEDLPAPFAIVATDLDTGDEVWLREGCLVDAIRASFSLPGFFEPVKIDGRWLVDGALVNPVPVSVCRALGADLVIAATLDAPAPCPERDPKGARSSAAGFDPRALRPGARTADGAIDPGRSQSSPRHTGPPTLLGVMTSTVSIVQDRITCSRLASSPPDVSINAEVGHIGLLDFHRASELIDEGKAAVGRSQQEIMDAIGAFKPVKRGRRRREPGAGRVTAAKIA